MSGRFKEVDSKIQTMISYGDVSLEVGDDLMQPKQMFEIPVWIEFLSMHLVTLLRQGIKSFETIGMNLGPGLYFSTGKFSQGIS